jgi:hypothetical protein
VAEMAGSVLPRGGAGKPAGGRFTTRTRAVSNHGVWAVGDATIGPSAQGGPAGTTPRRQHNEPPPFADRQWDNHRAH